MKSQFLNPSLNLVFPLRGVIDFTHFVANKESIAMPKKEVEFLLIAERIRG